MFKAVLDTNVVISAALSKDGVSPPAKIVQMALDGVFEFFCNEAILSEYKAVLAYPKFGFDSETREKFMKGLRLQRVSPLDMPTVEASDIPMSDESDRIFYDTAKSCGAYLVTGNSKHFPKEPFVVSPALFLELISA